MSLLTVLAVQSIVRSVVISMIGKDGCIYPDIPPRPCKCCGMAEWGKHELQLNYDSGYFWVSCWGCKHNGPEAFENPDNAVLLWNKESR